MKLMMHLFTKHIRAILKTRVNDFQARIPRLHSIGLKHVKKEGDIRNHAGRGVQNVSDYNSGKWGHQMAVLMNALMRHKTLYVTRTSAPIILLFIAVYCVIYDV